MVHPFFIALGVIIIAAIAYATVVGIRMLWLVRIGKKLVAESRPFEQANANAKLRILILGDSTAVGTGVRDPRGSIAGRFGWDFPAAEIRNLGINGLRVANLLRNFPSMPSASFDLVLIQIGANDIMQGTPLSTFERDLGSVFAKAKKIGTNVVALHSGNIGLAPLFAWPLSTMMRSRTLKIREVYKKVAKEHGVTYVDQFHEKADDPFNGEHRFYARDLLHLSEEGYGVWYGEAREAMRSARINLFRCNDHRSVA